MLLVSVSQSKTLSRVSSFFLSSSLVQLFHHQLHPWEYFTREVNCVDFKYGQFTQIDGRNWSGTQPDNLHRADRVRRRTASCIPFIFKIKHPTPTCSTTKLQILTINALNRRITKRFNNVTNFTTTCYECVKQLFNWNATWIIVSNI